MYRLGAAHARPSEMFRTLVVPNDDAEGYVPCSPTAKLLDRLTPIIGFIGKRSEDARFNSGEWRLVYCCGGKAGMTGSNIKAALQHRTTGAVRLATACDYVPTERHTPSVDAGWFVLHCDLAAPGMFWTALKHAL